MTMAHQAHPFIGVRYGTIKALHTSEGEPYLAACREILCRGRREIIYTLMHLATPSASEKGGQHRPMALGACPFRRRPDNFIHELKTQAWHSEDDDEKIRLPFHT